jgi:hypothetical protein
VDRNEEEGARLLAPLRDVEPDAGSSVDISRAMRAGRGHNRRRMLAGAVAAAGVTALSLVGVSSMLRSVPDGTEPASPAGEFSIARQAITVGTAGGYTSASYRTGRFEQVVELKRADGGTGYGRVTAYAPGRAPAIDTGTPAGDVSGRPGYWVPGQTEPTLAMQEGDVWVIVRLSGPDINLVERTHYVAQSVVFGANRPVMVPFTLDARPPGSLRVVGVQVSTDRPGAQVLLSTSDTIGAPVLAIGVSIDPADARARTETIGGHDAVVDRNSVTVRDVNGKGVNVSVRYDYLDQIGGIQTLKDLAAAVRPVPNLDNRSNWLPSPWT